MPMNIRPENLAPWLCGGAIGYRALKLTGTKEGEKLGLYGFGSSAHMVIQVARYLGAEVYVFTRSEEHKRMAEELGAIWIGNPVDVPPTKLDAAIIFAPAGELVINALRALDRGGRLVLAGIYMSSIPSIEYSILWEERSLKSVANVTREDVREFTEIAKKIPVRTNVETFELGEVNKALKKLKDGGIKGTGVLVMS